MSRNHFNELSPCEALIMKLIWEAPQDIPVQAHPELKSRPNRPHPLFRGFITAALEYQDKNH